MPCHDMTHVVCNKRQTSTNHTMTDIELANKETKVNPRKPPTQQQQKQQQQAPQASASQLASTLQATSVSAQAPAEVKKQASAVQEATTTSATSADNPLEKQQKVFQANPASYNGAIRDSYSWTQTIKDLDVTVKVRHRYHVCFHPFFQLSIFQTITSLNE